MTMSKIPSEITVARLQVVVMPNGEVICNGVTIGWFDTLKKFLSVEPPRL